MRNATKTVTFDFYFKYPHKGQFGEANAISVCEPGYEHRDVYRKMRGYVAEAQKGLVKMQSDMKRDDKPKASDQPDSTDDSNDVDAFMTMSLGLSIDHFTEFCEYVQRVLTNKRALAFVGDDPDDRVPITEEVWLNIANEGGMQDLERALAGFADFFLGGGPSKPVTKSGTASSSASPSVVLVSSPTKKRS